MYLGQVLKEILQMPRPTCPPAFPMENQHKVSQFLKTTNILWIMFRLNSGFHQHMQLLPVHFLLEHYFV